MGSYIYVKNYRNRQKENIIYVMGGRCMICGYNKCSSALEIHHLNPDEKEITISANLNKSWEKIVQELPKTILLCANCHREVEAGLIDSSLLKTSFDEEKAEEVSIKMKNHKTTSYCKICGKEITRGSTYCTNCYGLAARVVERPTREQLKYEIRNFSFTELSKKYGVTDNAIRKWCDKMKLPRKKSDIEKISDEDWLSV